MSDYLPDEVVETILWRLPMKLIMECRCVCKSWYSLITSPIFISNHLLHGKTLTPKNPQKFLAEWHNHDEIGKCLLHFDKEDYFRSVLLRLSHIPTTPLTQIVGSANGLICFSIGQDCVDNVVNLILFNPSIGKFQSILPPELTSFVRNTSWSLTSTPFVRTKKFWKIKGFGFDERTRDYKILLIKSNIGFIYSLNSNSWRMIPTPFCYTFDYWTSRPFISVVFVNGRFHWLASQSSPNQTVFVRMFDVKTETFGQISLPKSLSISNSISRFTEFGESSFAVIEYDSRWSIMDGFKNHIWVMKDNGSVKSWVKLVTIRLGSVREFVLGFKNEDEVFIRHKSGGITLQKINRGELQVKELINVINDVPSVINFSVHTYVPSLVLLDKENNVDVSFPTHTTTSTIIDIPAPTARCIKRIKTGQIVRRSQRIKHQLLAKYNVF